MIHCYSQTIHSISNEYLRQADFFKRITPFSGGLGLNRVDLKRIDSGGKAREKEIVIKKKLLFLFISQGKGLLDQIYL